MEEIPKVEIPEIGLHDIFEKLVLKDLIVTPQADVKDSKSNQDREKV
jgi:hypothetical protein